MTDQQTLSQLFQNFPEEYTKLRNKYRITFEVTEEDREFNPKWKVGDIVGRNPIIPSDPLEAFQLFENYYAAVQCELEKQEFLKQYKVVNINTIRAELKIMDNWIAEAEKKSLAEACKTTLKQDLHFEYLRLSNQFYHNCQMTWEEHNEASHTAIVYGRYFLFYNFLTDILMTLERNHSQQPAEINRLLSAMGHEISEFYKMGLEDWYRDGLNARIKMFGNVTELEHCERELLVQQTLYEKDLDKSVNHEQFNVRMLFTAIAQKRQEYIKLIDDKIENFKYPEVPFIGRLIHSNCNISEIVLNQYYNLMPQPHTSDKDGVIAKWQNLPYSLEVYGAYVLTKDWESLQIKRRDKIFPFDIVPAEKVEDALRRYGSGFKKGYYTFEKDLLGIDSIKDILSNNNLARIVFDYVFGSFLGRGGYPISHGRGDEYFANWYDTGIEAGRYYKAWCVMIEYYFVFEHFFLPQAEVSKEQANPLQKKIEYRLDYTINTSIVVSELHSCWKDFDRNLIEKKLKASLEWQFYAYDLCSFAFTIGSSEERKYSAQEIENKNRIKADSTRFPIPEFYIRPDEGDQSLLTMYDHSCVLGIDDVDFDFFFALQFYVTDLMDSDEFLHFHFERTFDSDAISYRRFLNKLCIKYSDFLAHKHERVIEIFFGDFLEAEETGKNDGKDQRKPQKNDEKISKNNPKGFGQGFSKIAAASRPIIDKGIIAKVIDILRPFFADEQHQEFEQIISTGGEAAQPLLFLDAGNRLADAFKQLKKADLITGCNNKQLETWILANFNYKHRGTVKSFRARYLSDIISTNNDKCNRPILNVTLDKSLGKYTITKA